MRRIIKKFCVIKRHGLTVEQSSNSFTDEDLQGMAHGNNPVANAYRELLALRKLFAEQDKEDGLDPAPSETETDTTKHS